MPEFRLHYMPDSFAAVLSEPLFKFSAPGGCSYLPSYPFHTHLSQPLLYSTLLLSASVGILCDKWTSHLNCIQCFIVFHFCFVLSFFSHELYKIHPITSSLNMKHAHIQKHFLCIRHNNNIHFTGHFMFVCRNIFLLQNTFWLPSGAGRRC